MPESTAIQRKTITPSQPSKRGRRSRSDTPSPNRDDLVKAVLMIEKRDGPGSLSMRKLAAEVGVSARLLYNIVDNKEELYELAANSLLKNWRVPPTHLPWQERFSLLIKNGLRLANTYPELARQALLNSLDGRDPTNANRVLDSLYDCLREAGLNNEDAGQVQFMYKALLLGTLDMSRHYQKDKNKNFQKKIDSALDASISLLLQRVKGSSSS